MADDLFEIIADYVHNTDIKSDLAYQTARLCFADALGCAILSLKYPHCTKLLGPVIPGTTVPNGIPIPGTEYRLDPIQAAFNFGTMIRWLDYNDTWLAKEWGHPSDNIGGLYPIAIYRDLSVHELLTAIIKAYEIQGILALQNSFNRIGLDHVILVKIATAAIVCRMLGASIEQTIAATSQAFIDNSPLRTYRHAPNVGSRKSWAAGEATSRGVKYAWMTMKGEMGYPFALNTKIWGFYDVLFGGKPFVIERTLGSYVIENILFKVSFPAEFHAQTAVECALQLHPEVKDRIGQIERIDIETHESAVRIIDKKGPLKNPADRDHSMQYMVATSLIHGELTSNHYHLEKHPEVDALREKMHIREHPPFSKDYLDPEKRSIASRLTITFKGGSKLGPLTIEYPLGHFRRRKEAIPLLFKKLEENLLTRFSREKVMKLVHLFQNHQELIDLKVKDLSKLITVTEQDSQLNSQMHAKSEPPCPHLPLDDQTSKKDSTSPE